MNVIDGEVSIHWKQFDLKNTLVAELLFVDFSDDCSLTYQKFTGLPSYKTQLCHALTCCLCHLLFKSLEKQMWLLIEAFHSTQIITQVINYGWNTCYRGKVMLDWRVCTVAGRTDESWQSGKISWGRNILNLKSEDWKDKAKKSGVEHV